MLKSVKLLHCADIHLDMPFTSLGFDRDKSNIRRQELKLVFEKIISLAKEERVDLLLLCGDLYEYGYTGKSTIHFICDGFRKIPEIQVFIIPGNHDPISPNSFYSTTVWPDNVHILTGKNPFFELKTAGVCVYGALPDTYPVDDTKINVLMIHGTLDMNISKNAFNPVSSRELESCGMDYTALGHFHSRFRDAGGLESIFNPGSPEPLGFDEEGEHGVFIATITKDDNSCRQTDVRFIRLNGRSYRNIDISLYCCASDEQAACRAAEGIAAAGGMENLYSIVLKGTAERGFSINTGRVAAYLKDKAFFIKVRDETVPDYDFNEITAEPGLRGLFARKMLERAKTAVNDEEKQLVMQALYYGMEAIDRREICI